MKNAVILTIAVLMLAKPLWPIVEYVMNYDYIANVLCENKDKPMLECDGKCYLAEMLARENKQNQENPFGTVHEIEIPQIVLYQVSDLIQGSDKYPSFIRQLSYPYQSTLKSRLLVFELIQPPQMA